MAGIPMARDPNQKCHGGSVGSEEVQGLSIIFLLVLKMLKF